LTKKKKKKEKKEDWQRASERKLRWEWAQINGRNFIVIASMKSKRQVIVIRKILPYCDFQLFKLRNSKFYIGVLPSGGPRENSLRLIVSQTPFYTLWVSTYASSRPKGLFYPFLISELVHIRFYALAFC